MNGLVDMLRPLIAKSVPDRLSDSILGAESSDIVLDHLFGLNGCQTTRFTLQRQLQQALSFAFGEHGTVPLAALLQSVSQTMVNITLQVQTKRGKLFALSPIYAASRQVERPTPKNFPLELKGLYDA